MFTLMPRCLKIFLSFSSFRKSLAGIPMLLPKARKENVPPFFRHANTVFSFFSGYGKYSKTPTAATASKVFFLNRKCFSFKNIILFNFFVFFIALSSCFLLRSTATTVFAFSARTFVVLPEPQPKSRTTEFLLRRSLEITFFASFFQYHKENDLSQKKEILSKNFSVNFSSVCNFIAIYIGMPNNIKNKPSMKIGSAPLTSLSHV